MSKKDKKTEQEKEPKGPSTFVRGPKPQKEGLNTFVRGPKPKITTK